MIFEAVYRLGHRILMQPQTSSLHNIGSFFLAVGTVFATFILQWFSAAHTAGVPDIYYLFSAVRTDSFPVYLSAERTDRLNSYNGWGKSSSVIDYIYYSGFASCPKFETIQKKYGDFPFISDHYPIKAVLIF